MQQTVTPLKKVIINIKLLEQANATPDIEATNRRKIETFSGPFLSHKCPRYGTRAKETKMEMEDTRLMVYALKPLSKSKIDINPVKIIRDEKKKKYISICNI